MNISEKHYPYPVLKPDGDDYENSLFDVDVSIVKSPDVVIAKFTASLRDNGLRRLIGVEHKAKILCHLECPRTVYRTCADIPLPVCETASEDEAVEIQIPAAALSGTVSVCPFIVATADIPAYSNESFNPDYECESFAIEAGAVMAEGRQKTFEVETAREALALSPSIFSVIPGGSDCKTLQCDWSGEKIRVYMPLRMFEQYGTLKDTPEDRETIWAMVFVPVLVEVLATLSTTRRYSREDFEQFSGNRWYRSVDAALRLHYDGHGIDSDQFQEGDCVEMASVIVKNSVKEAFANMAHGWAGRGDEE